MTKLSILAVLLAAAAPLQAATVITQWTFNSGDDGSAGTGTLTPSTGSGVFSNIGGTTATFAGGAGSTDPEVDDDSGRNLTTFPAATTGSGTAGVEFSLSTAGYEDIVITWDHRHSGTASKYAQLQYSTNGGGAWVTYTGAGTTGGYYEASVHDTFLARTADLSAVVAADNLADLRIRIVSVFDPATGTSYTKTNAATANYATSGTWRFDMVTISGSVPVPEPGAAGLLLGAAGLLLRRRRA